MAQTVLMLRRQTPGWDYICSDAKRGHFFFPECIVHFQFHYGHILYGGFFKEKGVSNGLCNESL